MDFTSAVLLTPILASIRVAAVFTSIGLRIGCSAPVATAVRSRVLPCVPTGVKTRIPSSIESRIVRGASVRSGILAGLDG